MFFKKFRQKLIIGGCIFLLLVGLLFFMRFRIVMDIGQMIMGTALLFAVYIVYLVVQHLKEPKRKVTVITRVKLSSPPALLKSVMTYKLKIESEHHIEEKGKERTVKMDEVMLSFNTNDHPNIYEHCLNIVARHTDTFVDRAEEIYPDAKIVGAPLLLPEELSEKKRKA